MTQTECTRQDFCCKDLCVVFYIPVTSLQQLCFDTSASLPTGTPVGPRDSRDGWYRHLGAFLKETELKILLLPACKNCSSIESLKSCKKSKASCKASLCLLLKV